MALGDHAQIGGQRTYFGPADDAVDVVTASQRATASGLVIGNVIDDLAATDLGVHRAISIGAEEELVPYVTRDHDSRLRKLLGKLARPRATSRVVVAVGGSCVGKTRAIYEAVQSELPDWRICTPTTPRQISQTLATGLPGQTILWLDELQDFLTDDPEAIKAAQGLLELASDGRAGPVLVLATCWESEFDRLLDRTGAVRRLVSRADVVAVPDVFSDTEVAVARTLDDARLRIAAETARSVSHPREGLKITQVLSGGTQLLNRLYPQDGSYVANAFTPEARAILFAAGDLRRIGLRNPIPQEVLTETAPGYDPNLELRPPEVWVYQALAEVTRDGAADDSTSMSVPLDINRRGVPGLVPHWIKQPDGALGKAYELHDYLYQDHVQRKRYSPISVRAWDAVVENAAVLDRATCLRAADAAELRGLFAIATTLTRSVAATGDRMGLRRLLELLARRAELGDVAAMGELRNRADGNVPHARALLAHVLVTRAATGDSGALQELKDRAKGGDKQSRRAYLASSLTILDDVDDGELSFSTVQSISLARLAAEGDSIATAKLKERADRGDGECMSQYAQLLQQRAVAGDRSAIAELRARSQHGEPAARANFSDYLLQAAKEGDDQARMELFDLADGGKYSHAFNRYTDLLVADAGNGDEAAFAEISRRVASGSRHAWHAIRGTLAKRAAAGDEKALSQLWQRAAGGDSMAARLLDSHRLRRLFESVGEETPSGDFSLERAVAENAEQARLAEVLHEQAVDLGKLALGGDDDALSELRARSRSGDKHARSQYVGSLAGRAARGDSGAVDELRKIAEAGDRHADYLWSAHLNRRSRLEPRAAVDQQDRARVHDFEQRGDAAGLVRLVLAGVPGAATALIRLYRRRGQFDVVELDSAGQPIHEYVEGAP